MIKKNKKIALLQNQIASLNNQLDELKAENKKLKQRPNQTDEVQAEKRKMEEKRKEYEELVKEVTAIRNEYFKKSEELQDLILEYKKNTADLIRTVKTGIKGIVV